MFTKEEIINDIIKDVNNGNRWISFNHPSHGYMRGCVIEIYDDINKPFNIALERVYETRDEIISEIVIDIEWISTYKLDYLK